MNDPIRILYSSLSGEIIGGGQHSLLLLLERLDRTRFTPFLVCPTPGDVIERARAMGIECAIIPMPPLRCLRACPAFIAGSPWFNLKSFIALMRFVKTQKIDLIHTDSPRQAFYLGLAGLFCRIPRVWHIRTSERQNRLFDRLLFAMANSVIPVSRAAAERFRGLPRQDKIRIVYNGIDVSGYAKGEGSQRIRSEFAPAGELLIGTAGQLIPEKGIETFLDAAALVCQQQVNDQTQTDMSLVGRGFRPSRPADTGMKETRTVRFLVIGRGADDYVAFLQKKAMDLGLKDRVIFTGFRRDMPQIMSALDIFVLPTKWPEGLSRALLEAMAATVPVITTTIGGNSELVVDGVSGILVPADDPQAVASAVLDLTANEKKRRDVGKSGHERVRTEFDLATNTRSIERIYDESLG